MAIRDIIVLPDPRLKQKSEPVETVTDEIRTLVADMTETMYDAPGIGLAAIQVGVPLRVVTVDVSRDEEARNPRALINPEVVWSSEEIAECEEGCLSIPDYLEIVQRPAKVRVRYRDLDGIEHEEEAEGLLAVCLQHEIDHLNGVLFIDHISKLKRDRVVKKFTKQARHEGREPPKEKPKAAARPETRGDHRGEHPAPAGKRIDRRGVA